MQHAVGRLPKELVTEWQSVTVITSEGKFRSGAHGAEGLLRELNPGPLAPEARIMPLDHRCLKGLKKSILMFYV